MSDPAQRDPEPVGSDVSPDDMELTVLIKTLRWLIWGAAILLPVLFAWLQLGGFAYGPIVETVNPSVVRHVALALYYICWVQGSQFDLKLQESVYIPGRPTQNTPVTAIILVTLFCLIAAALFWVSDDDRRFAVVLATLFVANIAGFSYILHVVRPYIAQSKAAYERQGKPFTLLRLEFVEGYMCGRWQMMRFAVGLALVGVVAVVTFGTTARDALAAPILRLLGAQTQKSALLQLMPSLSFILFIVIAEGWMWLMRFRVTTQIGVIKRLAHRSSIRLATS